MREGRSHGSAQAAERQRVLGVVLCGGVSRRMGTDKGSLSFGQETLASRSVRALDAITDEVVLACGSEPKYPELGLKLVQDSGAGLGPLEGIASCFESCEAEWLAVLACDLPNIVSEVPAALLRRAFEQQLDVCMLSSRGQREPLIAVYRRSCLAPIRAALSAGSRRVDSFHSLLRTDGLELMIGMLDVADLPEEIRRTDVTMNLNTPAQLAAAISDSTDRN